MKAMHEPMTYSEAKGRRDIYRQLGKKARALRDPWASVYEEAARYFDSLVRRADVGYAGWVLYNNRQEAD